MALLNHGSNKEESNKKLLTRGPKVEVNSKVNFKDLEAQRKDTSGHTSESLVSQTVTEPVNIRVDNHIRNQIVALITLGYGDTQKDMVNTLVNLYIEGLDKNDIKRFAELVDIYEQKDLMKHQKKKNKNKL